MKRKLFGTDGIRGTANCEPMTASTALRVGMAAGLHFRRGDHKHRALIGKDTRLSGYMLEPALTAGLISMGMDVILVGPLPTPAVALLTRSMRCDLGLMLSASHNPYEDNGIKLFGPDGHKLSDDVELAIERHVLNGMDDKLAPPSELGRARRLEDVMGRYVEFAKQTFPKGSTLSGLQIVLDCANGAGYRVAPEVLWELGAEIIPIGVSPDGRNINQDCGSTSPHEMRHKVIQYRADLGIALDGDGDRVVLSDETGSLIDGDQVMAMITDNWRTTGKLKGNGAVATVMSNLGLERYLKARGLTLARTQVGDRYVVEHMRKHGYNIGGEQSGHLIFSDYATTGDGLIAALQVLAVITQSQRRASEVCRVFEPLPQLLKNVRFNGGQPLDNDKVKKVIANSEKKLGEAGRLLIRKSGTEPVIRVMAEGEDNGMLNAIVDDICTEIQQAAAH